jgi:hypothetical protein
MTNREKGSNSAAARTSNQQPATSNQPPPAAARANKRYTQILVFGGILFAAAQVAAGALPARDPDSGAFTGLVLGALLGGAGFLAGMSAGLVTWLQKRLLEREGLPFESIFAVAWSPKISKAYFVQPIVNSILLLMVGTAVGFAFSAAEFTPARAAVLVLPSVLWFGVVLNYSSIASLRLFFERVQEAARAETEARDLAARAELTALRAQINPHFLFNALNTVANLIEESPARAERCVERLASVFRFTLARSPMEYIQLGEEVDFLRAYLEIEAERFGDRLAVEWDVDPEVETYFVPTMLLQPLVENALKHAIGPRRAGGTVRIAARRSGERLALTVSDFGGPPPAMSLREMLGRGTGLQNVNDRLERLYGRGSALVLEPHPEGGATFGFSVPAAGAADVRDRLCAR